MVRIQIQRIAHLKVQLDRIQSSIAGLHEIERLSLEKYERAARVMNLSTQDRAGVMAIRHAKPLDNSQESPPADRVLPGYAAELLNLGDLDTISTREEFEARAPLFCEFLKVSAREADQDIDSFTRGLRIAENSGDAKADGNIDLPQIVISWAHGPDRKKR